MPKTKPTPEYKNKVALAALEILMCEVWEATLHIYIASKSTKLSTQAKEDILENHRERIAVVYKDLKNHLQKEKVTRK